jgi:hypothetical protein
MLNVISLGAGVQSTTMALMAAHGEITPMPDCAIFADTGWEPAAVYDHLKWLISPNVLPFPVYVVSAGNIRDDLLRRESARAGRFVTIPAYSISKRGKEGIGRRQCTGHYKIEPLNKKVRELLGKGPRERIAPGSADKWIGISTDEIIRATPSHVRYIRNRHPLIENRVSRRDCLAWLGKRGYPQPPKSACIGCPFHGNATWRAIKNKTPEEWAQAVEIDEAIRKPILGLVAEQFLHPSRKPLAEVDLRTDAELGQGDLFDHECEGMCGV